MSSKKKLFPYRLPTFGKFQTHTRESSFSERPIQKGSKETNKPSFFGCVRHSSFTRTCTASTGPTSQFSHAQTSSGLDIASSRAAPPHAPQCGSFNTCSSGAYASFVSVMRRIATRDQLASHIVRPPVLLNIWVHVQHFVRVDVSESLHRDASR